MTRRLAALSVDLDEIDCYAGIHGLSPEAVGTRHAVYEKALPRLEALFGDEGVPATFFVIGRDLARGPNVDALRRLHEKGHELANHSLDHLYDLSRRDRATIRAQVEGGARRLEESTGVRPVGFRAPGYTLSDDLLDVLEDAGVLYDSSVFPCPSYYAAKAATVGVISLRGRRSQSVLDDPRVLSAPADPYRMGRPCWRRGRGILELPIGVTRGASARLPYIGTSVVMAGARGASFLTDRVIGRPLVNLELHGIDLADAAEDGLEFLRPHQPDLRVPMLEKRAALRAAIHRLRREGYAFVTLAEAAASSATD